MQGIAARKLGETEVGADHDADLHAVELEHPEFVASFNRVALLVIEVNLAIVGKNRAVGGEHGRHVVQLAVGAALKAAGKDVDPRLSRQSFPKLKGTRGHGLVHLLERHAAFQASLMEQHEVDALLVFRHTQRHGTSVAHVRIEGVVLDAYLDGCNLDARALRH